MSEKFSETLSYSWGHLVVAFFIGVSFGIVLCVVASVARS